MSPPNTPERRAKPCPLCGKPVAGAHGPFCSAGCRDRDLLNWLGESYRVPAGPAEGLDSDDDAAL